MAAKPKPETFGWFTFAKRRLTFYAASPFAAGRWPAGAAVMLKASHPFLKGSDRDETPVVRFERMAAAEVRAVPPSDRSGEGP